ncbi:hypothetical protein T01_14461 [Trichinella spiralis]|uniref:Uncharacterized protein n=1 Tax=Trichinella spiralis TaxID=6334 RepID=A0A0V1AKU4_TRISP|nr:hypothetical protein T01_14461 [Trichinella spiralis]
MRRIEVKNNNLLSKKGFGPTWAQFYSHSVPLFIYWSLSSLFYYSSLTSLSY